MYPQQMNGLFDSLTKLVGGASTFTTNLATQVVQGKQAYDATKAAWQGVPYPVVPTVNTAANPLFVPGGTGERLPAPIPATERPLTNAEIKELQTKLNAMGFNTGKVDGLYGPNTASGIKAFQQSYGYTVTGKTSVALLNAVRNAYNNFSPASGGTAYSPTIPAYAPTGILPASIPSYAGSAPQTLPPVKTTSEKLWTWYVPGAAAVIGAIVLLSSNRRRR